MKAYRIESAREALLNFGERDGDLLDCYEADITDLIADLLHLAEAEGVDPESVLRMAKMHWEGERVDDYQKACLKHGSLPPNMGA